MLGIDNVVFISILAGRLPAHQQQRARVVGLSLALVTRLLLLASLSWVIGLTAPLFTVLGQEISGRDVILLLGGLFLLGKATYEIHEQLEGSEHGTTRKAVSFASVIVQILILDVVFSLDSVITAVGMVDELGIMIAEGFDQHIPKGYVYGPIAFSILVEFLNLRVRAKRAQQPVHLHPTYVKTEKAE
ncbi:TerC family protein [Lentzea alba]|uniref:TerC family protein n=1 Tax=Lentzea alba TaxID=2714351 RepID=UPI0039BF8C30